MKISSNHNAGTQDTSFVQQDYKSNGFQHVLGRRESNQDVLELNGDTIEVLVEEPGVGDEVDSCQEDNADVRKDRFLLYGIEDRPPWYLVITLALQNVLTEFGGLFGYPFLIGGAVCIESDKVGFSEFICTVIFIAGLASLIQSFIGIRLPLLQGASYSFIMPVLVLMKANEHLCPDFSNPGNASLPFEKGSEEHKSLWKANLNEINGCLMVASLFQIVIGLTGLIGVMARYIGPLCVATTLTLIGLGVFEAASDKGSSHWGICMLTIVLVILFSQYLKSVQIPMLGGNRLPMFTLFPILLAVGISWMVCFILTVTGALPDENGQPGYLARTDIRLSAIADTKWFRVPYPCQWGIPTVTVGGVLGMIGAMVASTIESVGDYFVCAIICDVPPPPESAISRGIAIEGVGCLLGGLFGSGGGNTSYCTNMATIGLTKVASRSVIHVAGLIMLLLGCLGKFGGFFAMMPEPIVGGMLFVILGLVVAMGIASLHAVDLNSSRNVFIFGFSIILGLSVGHWVIQNPISVGQETVDQIVNILCGTSMFLGGMASLILDITIPGTKKERGFPDPTETTTSLYTEKDKNVYSFPIQFFNYCKFSRYIPILPGWDRKTTMTTTTELKPDSNSLLYEKDVHT